MGKRLFSPSYAYTALPGSARPLGRYLSQSFTRRRARRALSWLVGFLAVTLPLLYCLTTERFWRPKDGYLFEHVVDPAELAAGKHKLVLVLPVDSPSQYLCKVVTSAVALGYPAPVLVNWKKDFHQDSEGIGPSQLGKITGYLAYLEWALSQDAPPEQRLDEDDLVFGIDAHDIWLQLPPSVLIQRYYSINQRANGRMAAEYGFFDKDIMQQTILASSQKACFAPRDKVSNLHCGDVPESPLPDSVYGFFTDYDLWKTRSTYLRPKILNSGSFIGPAGDMRRYFQRTKTRMEELLSLIETSGLPQALVLGGDQGIFGEIMGEQEVWRQTVRPGDFAPDAPDREKALARRERLEYHVGLDYTQEIVFPTCYNEWQGFFVPMDDIARVEKESRKSGVMPPRIQSLGDDINKAAPPLAMLPDGELRNKSWLEMPLYVDFWTTAVPVGVHFNTKREGFKMRRDTWWDATWWFPHLRALLSARMTAEASREPLTVLEAADGPLEIVPYHTLDEPKPAMLFIRDKNTDGGWVLKPAADWDAICHGESEYETPWYDEVFRDGQGTFP